MTGTPAQSQRGPRRRSCGRSTAARPARDVTLELGRLVIQPGAGAPHATHRIHGYLNDFTNLVRLTQNFDARHMVQPPAEPQDVDPATRHSAMKRVMLTDRDKVPFVFSRRHLRVQFCFEMKGDLRGLSNADFYDQRHCYTSITAMQMVQTLAELCAPTDARADEIGLDALADVQPGEHFISAAQTMADDQTESYQPLVHDWSNIGQWQANGVQDTDARATVIWQQRLADFTLHDHLDSTCVAAIDNFIVQRSAQGGAATTG